MNVLKRIQELMEERNWTEYKLAKESNLSQSTISNLFHRNNTPSIPTIEAICGAFGITLSQFFIDSTKTVSLKEEELELLQYWSKLSAEQKQGFLQVMKHM